MIEFRNLTADEVECRISMVKPNGISLLLYKNARCDMNILDETVGPENWQREHYECKGNLFCKVGINTNYANPELPDRWVWKADCGTESYTEKEKGESSDSFKRSCFCWSIGRELYTAPFIWLEKGDYYVGSDGKPKDAFIVTKMEVVDKRITKLVIKSERLNRIVYTYETTDNYKAQCGLYLDSLAKALKRDKKDLYNQVVQEAGTSDYKALCAVLVDMLKDVGAE